MSGYRGPATGDGSANFIGLKTGLWYQDLFSPAASALRLPTVGIGVSTMGLTLADGDTTVDQWAATLGGQAALFGPKVAPGPTNRPAYSASGGAGGRPLVTFDGSNDTLVKTVTKGSVYTSIESGYVGRVVAQGSAGDVVMIINGASGNRYRIRELLALGIQFSVDNEVSTLVNAVYTTASNVTGHRSGDWSTVDDLQNARFTGVIEATAANAKVDISDGLPLSLGASSSGTIASNVALQAWYWSTRQLTADERTYLRALLTHYTGIAC